VIIFCHADNTCAIGQANDLGNFLMFFVLSLVFDQVIPLLTGSLNWLFYSWSGCLCCPVCRCYCPRSLYCFLCCLCKADDDSDSDYEHETNQMLCICPTKYSYWSILTFFPCRKFLNIYHLAENTFEDDKKLFQEQYPGRVAVDDVIMTNSSDLFTTEHTGVVTVESVMSGDGENTTIDEENIIIGNSSRV
jgi:hypothetical protein